MAGMTIRGSPFQHGRHHESLAWQNAEWSSRPSYQNQSLSQMSKGQTGSGPEVTPYEASLSPPPGLVWPNQYRPLKQTNHNLLGLHGAIGVLERGKGREQLARQPFRRTKTETLTTTIRSVCLSEPYMSMNLYNSQRHTTPMRV